MKATHSRSSPEKSQTNGKLHTSLHIREIMQNMKPKIGKVVQEQRNNQYGSSCYELRDESSRSNNKYYSGIQKGTIL